MENVSTILCILHLNDFSNKFEYFKKSLILQNKNQNTLETLDFYVIVSKQIKSVFINHGWYRYETRRTHGKGYHFLAYLKYQFVLGGSSIWSNQNNNTRHGTRIAYNDCYAFHDEFNFDIGICKSCNVHKQTFDRAVTRRMLCFMGWNQLFWSFRC